MMTMIFVLSWFQSHCWSLSPDDRGDCLSVSFHMTYKFKRLYCTQSLLMLQSLPPHSYFTAFCKIIVLRMLLSLTTRIKKNTVYMYNSKPGNESGRGRTRGIFLAFFLQSHCTSTQAHDVTGMISDNVVIMIMTQPMRYMDHFAFTIALFTRLGWLSNDR